MAGLTLSTSSEPVSNLGQVLAALQAQVNKLKAQIAQRNCTKLRIEKLDQFNRDYNKL